MFELNKYRVTEKIKWRGIKDKEKVRINLKVNAEVSKCWAGDFEEVKINQKDFEIRALWELRIIKCKY